MKKKLAAIAFALIILFAFSCSKIEKSYLQKPEESTPVISNFGQHEIRDTFYVNTVKNEKGIRDREFRQMNSITSTNPIRCILIKNGATVTDANWNNGVTFVVAPYENPLNLALAIEGAKVHFFMANVVITTDSAVFNTYSIWERTTLIVGSTEVLGSYPGYSWINSYLWGEDTPGFILTNKCNPAAMVTDITHLIAHESGHMFGLYHEYFTWGQTGAFMSGATIMGQFAGRNFANWSVSNLNHLSTVLQFKDDDYVNSRNDWVLNQSIVGQPIDCHIELSDIDVVRFLPNTTTSIPLTIKSFDCAVKYEIWRNGVKKFSGNTNISGEKTITIPKGTVPYHVIVTLSNLNMRHGKVTLNVPHG